MTKTLKYKLTIKIKHMTEQKLLMTQMTGDIFGDRETSTIMTLRLLRRNTTTTD